MSNIIDTEKLDEKSTKALTNKVIVKPRGRPLAFNQEDALESALQVFWSRGYEGASMAELADALGVNKPSIYATFGNKEALFRKVLAQYLAGPVAYAAEAMNEPTAYKVVEKFLTCSAALLSNPDNPRGCMIVQGALTCGQGSTMIQQELIGYRKNYENVLSQRFELAKTQGDLPAHVNAKSLAKYIATIHQGLSVQATGGASKDELMTVIDMALKNWPTT
ncbi:MAG: TetR/AcrR family transcriptional regulator [Bacteroidia bacterium]|nr:TetR/AcrR family transcriptional regulator [Methylotenera sp.]